MHQNSRYPRNRGITYSLYFIIDDTEHWEVMNLYQKKIGHACCFSKTRCATDKQNEKGPFLVPFCCTTRLDRQLAIKPLRKRENFGKRGHPRRNEMSSRQLLMETVELSNPFCGKLLPVVIAQWLTSLKARGPVDSADEKQVLSMRASTLDRILRTSSTAAEKEGDTARASENISVKCR